MQGGKLLIFADRFNASLDSMRARGSMLALPLELNLDDLFFGYGFRINYDLIRDMNCTPIPVILQTGQQGNQQLMPWVRSEEHTSELQSLMRISYAVFCLTKKKKNHDK